MLKIIYLFECDECENSIGISASCLEDAEEKLSWILAQDKNGKRLDFCSFTCFDKQEQFGFAERRN